MNWRSKKPLGSAGSTHSSKTKLRPCPLLEWKQQVPNCCILQETQHLSQEGHDSYTLCANAMTLQQGTMDHQNTAATTLFFIVWTLLKAASGKWNFIKHHQGTKPPSLYPADKNNGQSSCQWAVSMHCQHHETRLECKGNSSRHLRQHQSNTKRKLATDRCRSNCWQGCHVTTLSRQEVRTARILWNCSGNTPTLPSHHQT